MRPLAPEEKPFAALASSLERAGRVEDLIRLYESRAGEVAESGEAASLLSSAAELARSRLKDARRAEALLRKARRVAPQAPEPLRALQGLYEQGQDHAALAETLEVLGGLSEGAEAAAAFARAGELYEQKLLRVDKAMACYLRAAAAAPSQHEPGRRARRLLMDEARYDELLAVLDREDRPSAGLADEYATLAELLIDDPARHPLAERAITEALRLEPTQPRAQQLRKSLTHHAQTWRDRLRTLRGGASDDRDRRSGARKSLAIARLLLAYEPGSGAKIQAAIDRSLLLWPAMPEALTLLEQEAERAGNLASAATRLEKIAAERPERSTRVELLLRAGRMRLARLDDPAGALRNFEQAAALDPSRAEPTQLAVDLLLPAGRVGEAAQLLERHAGAVRDVQLQGEVRLRLSELLAGPVGNPSAARQQLEAILAQDPHHAEAAFRLLSLGGGPADRPFLALATQAPRPAGVRVALLRELAARAAPEADPSYVAEVVARALLLEPTEPALLSPALARPEVARAAAAMLDAPGRAWSAPLLMVRGALLEAASDTEGARAAYLEALAREPQHPEATRRLASLPPPSAPPPDDPTAPLRQALAAAPPGLAALEAGEALLTQAPDDLEAWRTVGAAAAALGRWERVAQVAAQLETSALPRAERHAWLSSLARAHGEAAPPSDAAAGLWLGALAEGLSTPEVLRALERQAAANVRRVDISRALAPHYAGAGDHQREAATLLVQIAAVRGRAEEKPLLEALASLEEQQLADGHSALTRWLRILELEPGDTRAREQAIRLGRDLLGHAEVARALVELAPAARERALARALISDATALYEEVGAIEGAERALLKGLELEPESPSTLDRLITLYLAAARFDDAERMLRRRAEGAAGEQQVAVLLRLSELQEQKGSPRAAAASLEEAFVAGANPARHRERWASLLRAGGQREKLLLCLEQLAHELDAAGEGEAAAKARLERAQLLEQSADDRAPALRAYEELLEAWPGDADARASVERLLEDERSRYPAAKLLDRAYERSGDHRQRVTSLEVIASTATDVTERLSALRAAAALQRAQLKQPDLAFVALARALKLASVDADVLTEARLAAEEADALDALADVLQDLLEEVAPPARGPLHRALAELHERLGDRPRAAVHLRELARIAPDRVESLEALRRLYRAGDEWEPLAEALEAIGSSHPRLESQVEALREAAVVHEAHLKNPARALAAWRQVVTRDPTDREAAAALDRLATSLGRPQDLAFALELQRAQETDAGRRRDLAMRLAVVRDERLSDAAGALALFAENLAGDPGHAPTRVALEALVERPTLEGDQAFALLDEAFRRAGDSAARASLRESKLASASAERRGPLLQELREIYERDLHQPERAFLIGLKAFAEGWDRATLGPQLLRLAERTDSLDSLAEVIEAAADALPAKEPSRPDLLRQAARLREKLEEPELAVQRWNELLAEQPDDSEALSRLGALYERSKSAKNLALVYARQAALARTSAERAELQVKAAVAAEGAGDDGAAIETFSAALSLAPGSMEALQGLDRLFGRRRRYAEQAEVVARLAAVTSEPRARRALLIRRARLLEKEGAGKESIAAFREALAMGPAEAEAIEGLERLLERDDVAAEAASLLEPLYRERKLPRKVLEVLDIGLERASGPERARLLREVAALREGLGEGALAFAARLRAFQEDPGDAELRVTLERSAESAGALEELVTAYESRLERGVERPLAISLWRSVAALRSRRLGRADLAARAWQSVIDLEGETRETLRALAEAQRRAGAFRPLAEVLLRLAPLEPTVDAQVNLLFEVAQLAEDALGDRALAATCYQKVLERLPRDRSALKSLQKVLADGQRHAELAPLLEREISLAAESGSRDEVLDLRLRLARLLVHRLSSPGGALPHLEAVLALSPAHPGAVEVLEEISRKGGASSEEALRLLEPLFAGEGRREKLIEVLEAQLGVETQPSARASILRRVAHLRAEGKDEPELAFLAAARAFREDPGEAASLALCRELASAADAREAFEALLEELAPTVPGPAGAELTRELAHLQEASGERARAIEAWRRVRAALPEDPEAPEALDRLYASQGRGAEQVALLRERSLSAAPAERASLGLRAARALEEAGDLEGAHAELLAVVSTQGTPEALGQLERLLARLSLHGERADVLSRLLELETDEDAGRALRVERARALVRGQRLELALTELEEVLARWPASPAAVGVLQELLEQPPVAAAAARLLVPIYRARGAHRLLAGALEAQLEGTAPEERAGLLDALATAWDGEGAATEAFGARQRQLVESPGSPEVLAAFESAAARAGAVEAFVAALEAQLSRTTDASVAATLGAKIASTYELSLQRPAQAIKAWEAAARRSPASPEPLRALARIYRSAKTTELLSKVLTRLVLIDPSLDAQIEALEELARIAEESLDDLRLAAATYRQLLDRRPDDLRAVRALARVLRRAGRLQELRPVLESEISLARAQAQPEAALDGRLALAALLRDEVGDVSGALTHYAEALEQHPDDPRALDALVEMSLADAPGRAAAAALVAPALERVKDLPRLTSVLEAHAAVSGEGVEKARLLLRAATLAGEALGDSARAFLDAGKALRAAPGLEEALLSARRWARESESGEELCLLLEELAPRADASAQPALFLALAEAQEGASDTEGAAASLARVSDALPGDVEVADRLDALLRDLGRSDERLARLRARVDRADGPGAQHALLLKIAEAEEQGGRLPAATEALRDAVALSPTADALRSLERLLGRSAAWLEQAEVLARLAALEPEGAAVKDLWLRRAEALGAGGESLAATAALGDALARFGREARLVEGLERLLDEGSSRAAAAALLVPLHRESQDRAGLARALWAGVEAAPREERSRLLREVTDLREGLGDSPGAFEAAARLLSEAPDEADVLGVAARLADAAHTHAALAALLEQLLHTPRPLEAQRRLWRQLAILREERLKALAPAAEAWEQVAALAPEDEAPLEALVRVHAARADAAAHARSLERLAKVTPAPESQARLLMAAAHLREDPLQEGDAAVALYREVLARDPAHVEAVGALARLLEEKQRYPELAALLRERIARAAEGRTDPKVLLDQKVQLAGVLARQLSDAKGARELLAEVLAEAPDHLGARAGLRAMVRTPGPARAEAAQLLVPLAEASGEHGVLAEALEVIVASTSGAADKVAVLLRLQTLYAKDFGDPVRAFDAAARALRAVPDSREALAAALLLGDQEPSAPLLPLLDEAATNAAEPARQVELYRALGERLERAERAEEAIAAYGRVRELVPDDAPTLDRLAQLFAKSEKWAPLAEVLTRQLALAPPRGPRHLALLQLLATLQQEQLSDLEGARQTLRRWLELAPQSADAWARLDAVCEALGLQGELAEVLERRVLLTPSGEAPEPLMFRLATVLDERLGKPVEALKWFQSLLAIDPRHQGALEHLERRLAETPEDEARAALLLEAHRRSGDHARRAALLEARVAVAGTPAARKPLLLELATLRERDQRQPTMAFLAMARAFAEDPSDPGLLEALPRLAREGGAEEALADAYQAALPRIEDPLRGAQVALALGVLAEELEDPARAVDALNRARELDPSLDAAVLPPLSRSLRALDRWEALAPVLERSAQKATTPEAQVAAWLELGRLCSQQLASPSRAAEAFAHVLAVDPRHLEAASALEEAQAAAGNPAGQAAALQIQRGLTSGVVREAVLLRWIEVLGGPLDDRAGAAALCWELLELNPRSLPAYAALEGHLVALEQHEALARMLELKLAQALEPASVTPLHLQLGTLLWKRLDRQEEATRHFEAVLSRDPHSDPALTALASLYASLGRQEELIDLLRKRVSAQEGTAGGREARLELAELLGKAGRSDEALDAGRRALGDQGLSVEALRRWRPVFLAAGGLPEAARTLSLEAEQLEGSDPAAAVALWFEEVALWEERGQAARAAPALERVLATTPSDRRAYERALSLYEAQGDYPRYAAVREAFLPHLSSDAERLSSLSRLAEVEEQQLKSPRKAQMSIGRALALKPSDLRLMGRLAQLSELTLAHAEHARLLAEIADGLPRGELAERYYLALGELLDKRLEDPAGAVAAFSRILEFDPVNLGAHDAVAAVHARRGDDRAYLEALERKREVVPDLQERTRLYREQARVQEERLREPAAAAESLRRAAELAPDFETLRALADLHLRHQQWAEAVQALIAARERRSENADRAAVQQEVASLLEQKVGDAEAAADAYRQLLELDPSSELALDALERLYLSLDLPRELLGVLERKLEKATAPPLRISLLFRCAELLERRLDNPGRADACLEQILSLDRANLLAIEQLERLRRAQGRWAELCEILERHLDVTPAHLEQAALAVQLGDVQRQELKDLDRAASSYARALEHDPRSRQAVHALGLVHERRADWARALEMLELEAQLVGAGPEAADLYFRAAQIEADMLFDLRRAKAAYGEALRVDPSHLPALRALRAIAEKERDGPAYERLLISEARILTEPAAKLAALLSVARHLAAVRPDDPASASFFQEALDLQPDSLDAALPLADRALARDDLLAAERLLEVVVRALSLRLGARKDRGLERELCRQQHRLGQARWKLGHIDRALEAFAEAARLDPAYLPAQEDQAALLLERKRLPEALAVLGAMLARHRHVLSGPALVSVHARMGEVHLALAQPAEARKQLELALAIAPGHEPSLRAMAAIADAAGDYRGGADFRLRLIPMLEGEARFQACVALGAIAREKLKDPHLAIDAYARALKVKPEDLGALEALATAHREAKQTIKAAKALENVLAHPAVKADRVRLRQAYLTMADLAANDLADLERAVTAYNAALDADPSHAPAFEALQALLRGQSRWKLLEESLVRMIARLSSPGAPAGRPSAELWRELGELRADKLADSAGALEAYRHAALAKPGDAELLERVGALAEGLPGREVDALDALRRALPSTRRPLEVSEALLRLLQRVGEPDEVFLAAQGAVELVGMPAAATQAVYDKLLPAARAKQISQFALTDRLWDTLLLHPLARGPLAELMTLLFELVGDRSALSHSDYGIHARKHRIELASVHGMPVMRDMKHVSRMLGLDVKALFSPYLVAMAEARKPQPLPDATVGLELLHTDPLSLRAGGRFFALREQREVLGVLAFTLTPMRPSLALASRLSFDRLELLVQAALSAVSESYRPTVEVSALKKERKLVEKALDATSRAALTTVARRYLEVARPEDLRQFTLGAELTPLRAALLVSGDAAGARRLALESGGAQARTSPDQRVRELLAFALGGELHTLRAGLGLAIAAA